MIFLYLYTKINVHPEEIAEWIFNDNVEKGIKLFTEVTDDAQLIIHIDKTMKTLEEDYCIAMDKLYGITIMPDEGSLTEEFKKEFLVNYLTIAKAYAKEFGYAFRIERKKDCVDINEIIDKYSKEE